MTRIKYLYKFFICLIIVQGCDRELVDPDNSRLGYDYFPLTEGDYKIYQVEEIEYTNLGEEIHSNYQLKIETSIGFQNMNGDDVYSMMRYVRLTENEPWELKSVWSARRDQYSALVNEENVSYQKLSFPISEGVEWDGNAHNILEEEIYHYNNVGSNFTSDSDVSYSNCVTVSHSNVLDKIVQTDVRFEVYCFEIGLLHKESTILNYCTDTDCLGQQIIETGSIYRQSLIEYGEN